MDSPVRSPSRKGHNKSKSAGVLKSIVKPSSRSASPKKRTAFAGDGKSGSALAEKLNIFSNKQLKDASPSRSQPLSNIENSTKSPPRRNDSPRKTLSLDLWDNHGDLLSPEESALRTPARSPPKKGFFLPKEKENTTPPTNGSPKTTIADGSTPIWAQFTSQSGQQLAQLRQPEPLVSAYTKNEMEHPAPAVQGPSSPLRGERRPSEPEKSLPAVPLASSQISPPKKPVKHTRQESAPPSTLSSPQKRSKVLAAVARLQSNKTNTSKAVEDHELNGAELESAFEAVLVSRNIPEHRRQNMRMLDAKIKREFVRNHRPEQWEGLDLKENTGLLKSFRSSKEECPSRGRQAPSETIVLEDDQKSQSRSRTFSWSKRSRSNSRPRSILSLKNLSSSSINVVPGQPRKETQEQISHHGPTATSEEFVNYLKSARIPEQMEIGRIHKLRLLLRNETVDWVASFIHLGGMAALVDLLRRIMKVEWREEHEDLLLHEILLCMKGLCTTERALDKIDELSGSLFPELVDMLFDEERKGPADFNTRGVITALLFAHLSAASPSQRLGRAQAILLYLSDRKPPDEERPAGFIMQMIQNRPYQAWGREVAGVCKEVFWIFLHHLNVVEPAVISETDKEDSYFARHFPKERPPVPAAPYIGGVEWEATNYLASHLDLLNGIIASLPSRSERNNLRNELRASGLEKAMGDKLRLCKEKFYGAVHDGLRTWVSAAEEDLWSAVDVRVGPAKPESPSKRPTGVKKDGAPAPHIQLPKLELGGDKGSDGWLS